MRADEPVGSALRPVPDISGPALGGDHRSPVPDDERLTARIARANRYFDGQLHRQREWYSRRASEHKKLNQYLGLSVIATGALITFAQAFAGTFPFLVSALSAALGVMIALLSGVQQIWKYDESWVSYRRASEKMKREYRLYVNNIDPYFLISDESEAYRILSLTLNPSLLKNNNLARRHDLA